jgi:hypothetical protein
MSQVLRRIILVCAILLIGFVYVILGSEHSQREHQGITIEATASAK